MLFTLNLCFLPSYLFIFPVYSAGTYSREDLSFMQEVFTQERMANAISVINQGMQSWGPSENTGNRLDCVWQQKIDIWIALWNSFFNKLIKETHSQGDYLLEKEVTQWTLVIKNTDTMKVMEPRYNEDLGIMECCITLSG